MREYILRMRKYILRVRNIYQRKSVYIYNHRIHAVLKTKTKNIFFDFNLYHFEEFEKQSKFFIFVLCGKL